MVDWSTTTVRHGTPSGWGLHQRLGERPCTPCYTAKRAYDARRRTSSRARLSDRRNAKAQGLAYRALAARYPDEYRELYLEFKARLIAEEALGGD